VHAQTNQPTKTSRGEARTVIFFYPHSRQLYIYIYIYMRAPLRRRPVHRALQCNATHSHISRAAHCAYGEPTRRRAGSQPLYLLQHTRARQVAPCPCPCMPATTPEEEKLLDMPVRCVALQCTADRPTPRARPHTRTHIYI
jgi:hypothetical protein